MVDGYLDAFELDGFSVTSGGSGDAAVNDKWSNLCSMELESWRQRSIQHQRLHHF